MNCSRLLLISLCMASILCIGVSTDAMAGTKRVKVEIGKRKLIDVIHYVTAETCSSLLSAPRLTTPAENGKLEVGMVRITPDKGPCQGRSVDVIAVRYTPNRGFSGVDRGTISFLGPTLGRRYQQSEAPFTQKRSYRIKVE